MNNPAESNQLPSFKHLISSISDGRNKDYTYTVLFFVVFSIFIFFAIRPSLSTAINLSKQEIELTATDKKYELLIGQIVQIQSALESVRDKLYLIDEALPSQPFINIIMSDIQNSALKNNVAIRSMNVQKINLVESNKKALRSMVVNVELGASFDDYVGFQRDLIGQRRLKNIKSTSIDREVLGSGSATLQIKAEIESYYL